MDVKKTKNYIKRCFEVFDLNCASYFGIFSDKVGEEPKIHIPLQDEKGDINMSAIEFASEVLGISMNDITENNEAVIEKRYNEYDFFKNYKIFSAICAGSSYNDKYIAATLLENIFGEKVDKSLYMHRFDSDKVKERLIETLTEMDEIIPHTMHYGAEITELSISTEYFCRMKNMRELVNSYINMAKKSINLFLEALKNGLSQEDIYEYNFLVTFFELCDKNFQPIRLYYDNLMICKELYKDVDKTNICEHVRFGNVKWFAPWRCADFVNDEETVKEFVKLFPNAKTAMRCFADYVSNYYCSFVWSDAQPALHKDDEFFGVLFDEEDLKIKERTRVYVKKTEDEFFGEAETAKKLEQYCRPGNLGGLPADYKPLDSQESWNRIRPYIEKTKSFNYFDNQRKHKGGKIDD